MKSKIQRYVDQIEGDLIKLSHQIHARPELRFEERTAVKLQTELLRQHGFAVDLPFAGLETAYQAVFRGSGDGPCVAFLAEYDALESMGHGCGHNLIAAMSVGAAIALSKIMQSIPGQIRVMGCPGEEGGKGKIRMLSRGGFDGIDFAMMIHPSTQNLVGRGGLAACVIDLEFRGKAAHSKEPHEGINALTALIQTFNGIDALRQCWNNDVKINGVITDGGKAPNIIPDFAAAKFTARAKTIAAIEAMLMDIQRAVRAAEALTGAKAEFKPGLISSERYPNAAMGMALKKNMAALGVEMKTPPKDMAIGSSDFGNVSMRLPGIHEYLAIAEAKVKNHTPAFAEAAASARADQVLLKGAKGLAMTAYDILTDERLRLEITDEFKKTVPIADTPPA